MPPLTSFQKTCIGLTLSHLAATNLSAATITVNVATDNLGTNSGSNCTLRKALESINNQSLRPGCQNTGAGFGNSDTVIIDPRLSNNTIGLQGSRLFVGGNDTAVINTTIQGNGITVNGRNRSGIFRLFSGDSLNIESMAMINGEASVSGGAIRIDSNASMTLSASRISNNETTNGSGGAISLDDYSSLVITNSTLSDNTAYRNAGAIRTRNNTYLSLSDVEISRNQAFVTGGIQTSSGSTVKLENCLIRGNNPRAVTLYGTDTSIKDCRISNNVGGLRFDEGSSLIERSAIYVNGGASSTVLVGGENDTSVEIVNSLISNNSNSTALRVSSDYDNPDNVMVTLRNVTVTNNGQGASGTNLEVDGASLSVMNSIVSNSGSDCSISGNAVVTTDSNSIIQDGSCGGSARAVDPLLGPLQLNGEEAITPTHALLETSPAIDSGNNSTCERLDQRGGRRARSSANPCDVGSFELGASFEPLPETSTFIIPLPNGRTVIFDL